MPVPAYMTIEGATQGDISAGACSADSIGTLSKSSHEDEIMVQAFSGDIIVPKDPQSGQPSGQRVHDGFTITKIFDKSSPMLYQALSTGEQLNSVVLKWFRTAPSGEQEHYFTIEAKEATITGIRTQMPNCLDPNNNSFTHMEEVSFSYKEINWTHEVAGTSGTDSWNS
ncbi:Hcp family type VI secretion system effector [Neptunicella marina]|uniref:Hcp family type VI secretion system effector n=1 Tax=Neptunicella marina TaxID=2125989 RepID=A0A8J6ISJ7_9ALTE|nr:Hcp family type VI secretion system effector [Neptunicella marina]MBC3766675.1 Hcp family type VI secretion system effector [Neptunicella marina]